MAVKIRLKDLQLGQLNTECLLLVSRFVRVLKQHNGTQLRMQDDDILNYIADYARRTRNKELKAIYTELKEEITKSVYQSIQKE